MKILIQMTIASMVIASCSSPIPSNAQTTWQVGNTTLTQTDLVTGINLPWEILWGPDDYIWCTLRTGQVLRIDPITGNYVSVLNISNLVPSGGSSEPGLLGMTMHPNWAATPKVFLVYNYMQGNSVRERLVAYDWDGTALVNAQTLIDNIPGNYIHNGSRLVISPDGKIMMTTGDTGGSQGGVLAQNVSSLNGKTLRINLDGSIPSDNPDPESYVWSFGHRNSQGLCYGPTGILYSSEHGQSNSDEFNIIEVGRNYGWPTVEGACNTPSEITFCTNNNVREPLMEWSPCPAVNGITYYNHEAIPEWQHSILMGAMGGLSGTNSDRDRVSVLHLSEDGMSVTSEDKYFTSLNQRFRDICINPYDGSVYVALNGTGYPGSGPNKILKFSNEAFVSVEKPVTKGQMFNLYPNPAKDSVTIDAASTLVGGKIEVYSHSGKVVKELIIKTSKEMLDISDLAKGQYWILATSAAGSVTRSFIKE